MIKINNKVKNAIKNNTPVVALESTIISHGMPFPKNLEVAKKLEQIIEENGVTPATIAIINGEIKVGLNSEELEMLAKKDFIKVSKRDISKAVSEKLNGATTVSSTVIIAAKTGIKVFATGGIGGVHRDFNNFFDVSRDLREIAESEVCVVCSGIKSILDLPRTLEYLETEGVEVIGFRTKVLPAFYSNNSPYELNHYVESYKQVASVMHAKWKLGIKGGLILTNPIQKEYSLDYNKIERTIEKALKYAQKNKVMGKDVTPYLLKKINDLSGGKSLEANIKLVYNNAKVAAKIAKAYNETKNKNL
jgi:pseudouridine-5'-phosphate glycosidase